MYSFAFSPICYNWLFYNLYQPSFQSDKNNHVENSCEFKNVFTPIQIKNSSSEEVKITPKQEILQKYDKPSIFCEKMQTQQDEYIPKNTSDKKTRKNQQNENRNIIPNIINQILSYLQKKNKSSTMAQKIFQRLNMKSQWNLRRFYLYQNMLKNKISHYVNEDTMKLYKKTYNVDMEIFQLEEQKFYNKVSRILISHFLNTEAQTSTLTSRRMDRSKKSLHIQAYRILVEKIKELYKNQ